MALPRNTRTVPAPIRANSRDLRDQAAIKKLAVVIRKAPASIILNTDE
jgi:hypothetical protein